MLYTQSGHVCDRQSQSWNLSFTLIESPKHIIPNPNPKQICEPYEVKISTLDVSQISLDFYKFSWQITMKILTFLGDRSYKIKNSSGDEIANVNLHSYSWKVPEFAEIRQNNRH